MAIILIILTRLHKPLAVQNYRDLFSGRDHLLPILPSVNDQAAYYLLYRFYLLLNQECFQFRQYPRRCQGSNKLAVPTLRPMHRQRNSAASVPNNSSNTNNGRSTFAKPRTPSAKQLVSPPVPTDTGDIFKLGAASWRQWPCQGVYQ